jgi:hypothetical protein
MVDYPKALSRLATRMQPVTNTAAVGRALMGGLVALSLLATSHQASAIFAVNPPPAIASEPTFSESTTAGVTSYSYGVISTGGPITEIIIPEIDLGDFLPTGDTLPSGWNFSQQATPPVTAGLAFDDGQPVGAEITLSGPGMTTVNFTLESDISSTLNATWVFSNANGAVRFDPPVPDPEPASITLLTIGALGAFKAARRRVRANASRSTPVA